ncbi:hypothetical protein ACOMHN_036028 [Nucella lapillus]
MSIEPQDMQRNWQYGSDMWCRACEVCGQLFKNNEAWIRHKWKHRDSSSFKHQCVVCQRKFYLPLVTAGSSSVKQTSELIGTHGIGGTSVLMGQRQPADTLPPFFSLPHPSPFLTAPIRAKLLGSVPSIASLPPALGFTTDFTPAVAVNVEVNQLEDFAQSYLGHSQADFTDDGWQTPGSVHPSQAAAFNKPSVLQTERKEFGEPFLSQFFSNNLAPTKGQDCPPFWEFCQQGLDAQDALEPVGHRVGDLSGARFGRLASLDLALQLGMARRSNSPRSLSDLSLVVQDKAERSCPVCGKEFTHPYSLSRHKQKCQGTYKIICTMCGYKTHRSDHYWLHMKRLHNVTRPSLT